MHILFRLVSILSLVLIWMPASEAVNIYLTEVTPYAFAIEHKDKFDGVNVRIVKELSKRSGIPLDIIVVPSSRHVTQFPLEKEAYSISQVNNFTEEEGVQLADITTYPIVVVITQGAVAKSYEDLIRISAEKGIGTMRRLSYGPFGQDGRIKKVEVNTLENGFRMLESGRLAGLIGSQPAILAAAEKTGSEAMLTNVLQIGYGAHVLRSRPEFAKSPSSKALVQAIQEMKKDGTIMRILGEFQKR
ncbi:substrate-binding periplasmic protein [Undibacterium sp. RuTC16W]|uniref:substrate-binding periplasmic protein n=1 Tax=Undibacterium sp. RuTC16W TaxID=3413048 RepID=UPI003BF31F9D